MILGILADIHECLPNLAAALACLAAQRVDRIIFLGDLCETGRHLRPAVDKLRDAGAVGVFGNHDMGLIVDPDPEFRAKFDDVSLAYLDGLADALVVEDCRFSHVQTWMSPRDFDQPWYLHGPPETPELIARNFAAVPERVLFQGHYHCWLASDRHGPRPWAAESPITLDPDERHIVLVDAVLGGWCSTFETDTARLVPHRIGPEIAPGT